MLEYGRNLRNLAGGYAALAGAVDAIGFLKSGGLFVSFMSGNSTLLAVGFAQAGAFAAAATGLIALFVTGVILNVIVSEGAPSGHRKVVATISVALLLLAAGRDGRARPGSSDGHPARDARSARALPDRGRRPVR